MSSKYRGVLRVAGSTLKGWLVDVSHPGRRVTFDLYIDRQFRGVHAANRRRRSLVALVSSAEGAHSFAIPIQKPWVNGALQNIRLENAGGLLLTLAARLGPEPGQLFDEHVVSGQVSIGDRLSAASKTVEQEQETQTEPPHRGPVKALLRQAGSLSDADLISFVLAMFRDILLSRLERYEKANEWQSASAFKRLFSGAPIENALLAFGRNAIGAQNWALARRVTAAAAALHPQSFAANFNAGIARAQQGDPIEGLEYLRVAESLEDKTVGAKRQIVSVLEKAMRGELAPDVRSRFRADLLSRLGQLNASSEPGVRLRYRLPFATALHEAGESDEAMRIVDGVLDMAPNDPNALLLRARLLLAGNDIDGAYALYERVLELVPDHQGARLSLRRLSSLISDQDPDSDRDRLASRIAIGAKLAKHTEEDWIEISKEKSSNDIVDLRLGLALAETRGAGCALLQSSDGRTLEFWRLEAVAGLVESGLIPSMDEAASLTAWKGFYVARGPRKPPDEGSGRGNALIVGEVGASAASGQRALNAIAAHHKLRGFAPSVVRIQPSDRLHKSQERGRSKENDDVILNAAHLRRVVLERNVKLVHAISGTGGVVAEALDLTNVAFVFGIHGWYELMGGLRSEDAWIRGGRERAFAELLSRADAVYAASRFAQIVVEEKFGVRCPIGYSHLQEM